MNDLHYRHDGYYFEPEALAARIERYDEEGWRVVAIVPSMKRDGVQTGASILVKHPSQRLPSWERTDTTEPEMSFEDLLKRARPLFGPLADMIQSFLREPKP